MADAPPPDADPVERFRPSSGYWMGWAGVVGFGALAVETLVGSGSAATLATAAGLCWAAMAMWIGLVRPGVRAYGEHLLLRNWFRDTEVPWHLVDGVVVRHTLRVHVGDEVHHGAAISRSARSMRSGGARRSSSGGGGGLFGVAGMVDAVAPQPPEHTHPAQDHAGYVETRLRDLAGQRADASRSRPRVVTRWAVAETTAFVLLTVGTAVLVVFNL